MLDSVGVGAEHQPLGDRGVAQALGEQLEHLQLTGAEGFAAGSGREQSGSGQALAGLGGSWQRRGGRLLIERMR
jgi:hypothetical protein